MWCNGSTLALDARDVGSIPTLGTISPIFITSMTLLTSQGGQMNRASTSRSGRSGNLKVDGLNPDFSGYGTAGLVFQRGSTIKSP